MTKRLRNLALAGAAGLALALGGAAYAKNASPQHVMAVSLPNGGVATIRYSGEKPDVTISSSPFASAVFPFDDVNWRWPLGAQTVGVPSVDSILADMDREVADMQRQLQRFDQLATTPVVSGANAAGVSWCSESVSITEGPGHAPQVERHVAGTCASNTSANAAAHQPRASNPSTAGDVRT